jgi:hypothetical protein
MPFLPFRENQAADFRWLLTKHNTGTAMRLMSNDAISPNIRLSASP